jgi:ribosomal protein S18 acetylase RimI-like enzyme
MASTENQAASAGKIALRPASANDSEFLIHVYASTRWDEMASWRWSPAQQESFVRMQYNVRQRGYAAAYPTATVSIISVDGVPAGSIIIFRGPAEIRLLDISLLEEYRGHGIGRDLIRALISEAARSKFSLRLNVLRSNRAAHLYERLGFVAKGGDPMYSEMEWAPAPGAENLEAGVFGE